MKRHKKQSGFSLIEIMIVIVIIAIMAGTVSIASIKYIERAKVTKTKTQIRSLKDHVNTYKMEKSEYPEELLDLVPDYIDDATTIKDGWDKEFYYAVPGDNAAFEIISGGADLNIDTTDDNINSWELGKRDDAPQ